MRKEKKIGLSAVERENYDLEIEKLNNKMELMVQEQKEEIMSLCDKIEQLNAENVLH